jgi:uroporphyrin-III C-methyltransferase/precorrin-2 dehydrogenase/sirohydrochlorin ferrochelatase
MEFFPLFARLANHPCLVVGGGDVARRKVLDLLAADARVTVNTPVLCPELETLAATGRITLHRAPFDAALVESHLLVIAATSDPAVNAAVAAAARDRMRLCNVVDDGDSSTFIVPSVIDRDPIVLAVSSGGRAPLLARLVRQRLERWLPPGLGHLARWAGGWRQRVRRTLAQSSERRRFWEQVLDGPAGRHAMAGDEAAADAAAAQTLESVRREGRMGRAWLVGAGPGDPSLITVRGLEVLQSADVILHDRLIAPQLLELARREAEIIDVGKTPGGAGTDQDTINALLVSKVRAGHRVCRLKGGDPLIFGRGGEEALALAAAGLPFEIVPGITAAAGCAASAGIPLTHRGLASGVTLVTAHEAPGTTGIDWAALARLDHTLVLYMGAARVAQISDRLMQAGRDPQTPAIVVSHGTTPEQRQVSGSLADIAERSARAGIRAPALLFVGRNAALAASLCPQAETPSRDASASGAPAGLTVLWPRAGTGA